MWTHASWNVNFGGFATVRQEYCLSCDLFSPARTQLYLNCVFVYQASPPLCIVSSRSAKCDAKGLR